LKRALKFLLVFVAATVVIVLAAGIPNYSAFKTLFSNTDGMREGYEYVEKTFSLKGLTEFIGEHPEYMSVVSFNVDQPDSGIYYGANIPRAQGAISNLFLVMEYERQVLANEIDPNEPVAIKDIERLFLPQISENAHNSSLEALEILAQDGNLTLDEVVATMIETNGLALSDYVWFKLGKENIFNLMNSLNLEITEPPLPFAGLYLSIHPTISDTSAPASYEKVIELAEKFNNEDSFNSETKELFEDERLNLSFIQEKNALAKFPQTTAMEMATLMAKLEKEELISKEVSKAVKEKMKWVFGGEAIKRSFSNYGAIYDNRMGMLSGIDFGTSVFDGHTSAQAVFFDQLPVAFFIHLSANHMQEDYQQRLIWDPALYQTTIKEIERNN
tara:strand:- start:13800 stop:14960 length:1161 start_codon:yes stop_codon:yes gene_type:complete